MTALVAQRRQPSAREENMIEDGTPVSDVDDVIRRQKKSLLLSGAISGRREISRPLATTRRATLLSCSPSFASSAEILQTRL